MTPQDEENKTASGDVVHVAMWACVDEVHCQSKVCAHFQPHMLAHLCYISKLCYIMAHRPNISFMAPRALLAPGLCSSSAHLDIILTPGDVCSGETVKIVLSERSATVQQTKHAPVCP